MGDLLEGVVLKSVQPGSSASLLSFSNISTQIVAHPLDAEARLPSTDHLHSRSKNAAVSDTREAAPSSPCSNAVGQRGGHQTLGLVI